MKRQMHFTLVELLTVIAVIAVLLGLLFPAIGVATKKVKVARARGEIQSLMTAIKMYETQYGYLPVESNPANNDVLTATEYDQLIAMLSQTDKSGNSYKNDGNSRRIRMIEVKKNGEFLDPWGFSYNVIMDADYDGSVPAAQIRAMTEDVPSSIVIWSAGPDKKSHATASKAENKDNVFSLVTNWQDGVGHKIH